MNKRFSYNSTAQRMGARAVRRMRGAERKLRIQNRELRIKCQFCEQESPPGEWIHDRCPGCGKSYDYRLTKDDGGLIGGLKIDNCKLKIGNKEITNVSDCSVVATVPAHQDLDHIRKIVHQQSTIDNPEVK